MKHLWRERHPLWDAGVDHLAGEGSNCVDRSLADSSAAGECRVVRYFEDVFLGECLARACWPCSYSFQTALWHRAILEGVVQYLLGLLGSHCSKFRRLPASFFLPSHLSFKNMYICVQVIPTRSKNTSTCTHTCTCTCIILCIYM